MTALLADPRPAHPADLAAFCLDAAKLNADELEAMRYLIAAPVAYRCAATRPYQVASALHRLELAALEYVASRGGPLADRLFNATVALDRACHALAVAMDDTGMVSMPVKCPRCLGDAP